MAPELSPAVLMIWEARLPCWLTRLSVEYSRRRERGSMLRKGTAWHLAPDRATEAAGVAKSVQRFLTLVMTDLPLRTTADVPMERGVAAEGGNEGTPCQRQVSRGDVVPRTAAVEKRDTTARGALAV